VTYSNCVLVYTISKKTWHLETYPFTITAMARLKRKTLGTTELYDEIYLGDSDGFIYRTNTGNADYNGTVAKSINGRIQTKEYPLNGFPKNADLEYLWFLAQQAVGTKINFRLDRRDKWQAWKDLQDRITEGNLSGRGKTIQFTITDNSQKQSQVEGFLIQTKGEDKK